MKFFNIHTTNSFCFLLLLLFLWCILSLLHLLLYGVGDCINIIVEDFFLRFQYLLNYLVQALLL